MLPENHVPGLSGGCVSGPKKDHEASAVYATCRLLVSLSLARGCEPSFPGRARRNSAKAFGPTNRTPMMQASNATILSMEHPRPRTLDKKVYNGGKDLWPRNQPGKTDRRAPGALHQAVALLIPRLPMWMTDGFRLRRSFLAQENR